MRVHAPAAASFDSGLACEWPQEEKKRTEKGKEISPESFHLLRFNWQLACSFACPVCNTTFNFGHPCWCF